MIAIIGHVIDKEEVQNLFGHKLIYSINKSTTFEVDICSILGFRNELFE